MILVVPAERGKHHANVNPGYRHAGNVRLDVPQDRVGQDGHVVEVPAVFRVGI